MKPNVPETGAAPEEVGRRKGHLSARAAGLLRAQIMSGELPPLTRLREVELCAQYGMSRTPLREAFRTLAVEGLVDLLPNRSVLVSDLNQPDIEHLLTVFATIEGLGARLACEAVTDGELTHIGELLAQMVDLYTAGKRTDYLAVNREIHSKTMQCAANPILLSIWEGLLPRIERARALPNLDSKRWTEALIEHTKMFTALVARDGPHLEVLTRQHFLNGLPYLRQSIQVDSLGAHAGKMTRGTDLPDAGE